jgi:uncharacterized protein (DUF1501 family)
MNRRQFLSMTGAFAGCTSGAFAVPPIQSFRTFRVLVIVELDGGNDALNTVIPISDPLYRTLRPTLAISRDRCLPLDARTALHPSLWPLMNAWRARDLAIVQGVGHQASGRSHFRSKQIWETASDADEYRSGDWLQRVGVTRAPDRPGDRFAASCDAAAHRIVQREAGVVRITLHGFDTHENQALRHASLLAQFADGMALLRAKLIASGDWRRTLVMTCSEFGRSARENAAEGTEHGAAAAHFLMGGNLRGGVFGIPPRLDALGADQGVPVSIDFRRLYATALAHLDCTVEPCQRSAPLQLLQV